MEETTLQETGAFLAPLYAKIARISGEIGAIQKDANHPQNYKYHSSDAIMGALNQHMASHGMVIIPTAQAVGIEEGRYIIRYRYLICDAETGASIPAEWTGEAPLGIARKDGSVAIDDKAMGKAHTYAYKYWLMKLFMVSTIDTADLDTNDNSQSKAPAKKEETKKTEKQENLDSWQEDDLKVLIRPLYEDSKQHFENAVPAAFTSKLIRPDMSLNEAAAAMLCHRAQKDFGFNHDDITKIIGKTPETLLLNTPAFFKAWALIKQANAENPLL